MESSKKDSLNDGASRHENLDAYQSTANGSSLKLAAWKDSIEENLKYAQIIDFELNRTQRIKARCEQHTLETHSWFVCLISLLAKLSASSSSSIPSPIPIPSTIPNPRLAELEEPQIETIC